MLSFLLNCPNSKQSQKKTNKMKWKQNIFEGGRKIVHTEDWRLNGTLIIIKEYYLLDVSFNKTVINVWLCCHRKYNTIIKENKENEKRFSHAKHRNWTWKKICKWLRRFSIRSVCDYCILYTSIANEMDKKNHSICVIYINLNHLTPQIKIIERRRAKICSTKWIASTHRSTAFDATNVATHTKQLKMIRHITHIVDTGYWQEIVMLKPK